MSEDDKSLTPDYRAIPSDRLWFDPRVLSVNTYPFVHDESFVGLDTRDVVKMNSRRWGLGFFQSSANVAIQVGPWPDPQTTVWQSFSLNNSYLWYNLFTIGPMICNGWSIYAPLACTIRVVELLRRE